MLKKRNKLGKMLLIIMSASILSSVNVFAEEKSNLNQDITTNSIKETLASDFDFDATTGTITKYKGSDSNVIIPSEINGIKVTSIGDDAFEENADITSVEIPDGVTSIGVWSFYKCSELTKVTIPDSVTSINGIKSFSLPRIQVFYVNSERVKQLLINKVKIDESKIILNNQSSSESKSTETTNANNSTQTSVANEINNIFKWEKNSDGTWKLTKGGIIQVGWQQVNGQWYLMNSNGIMQTGWQPASGNWYYLNNSGEMASNTTINGYKVGSDGAWIE